MGIRKEIKAVLREMDVRDPRQTIAAIERLVTAKITKPKKAPHLIVTQNDLTSYGVKVKDAPAFLKTALIVAERLAAMAEVNEAIERADSICANCENKDGCDHAN